VAEFDEVLADLSAECAELDGLVAPLDDAGWARETPAPGWTIAHQIAHLAWTDDAAVLAATDAEEFGRQVQAAIAEFDTFVDKAAEAGAAKPPAEILDGWRAGRARLGEVLTAVPAGAKIPWFGPPMSPMSMATARLMETWAHAQDIAETLGITVEPTDRIKHVAHIGVRARDFAFANANLEAPTEDFRVELTAPSGELWTWGPEGAEQIVRGPAYDFCLRVTQRRHRDDLDLVAVGKDADKWLDVAQAFAGPSGPGRRPVGRRP